MQTALRAGNGLPEGGSNLLTCPCTFRFRFTTLPSLLPARLTFAWQLGLTLQHRWASRETAVQGAGRRGAVLPRAAPRCCCCRVQLIADRCPFVLERAATFGS